MYGGREYSFQVDSEIVQNSYNTNDNYLIEYSKEVLDKEYCAIYFTSNFLYFPNDADTFRKRVIERNAFEWYGIRYPLAQKHIFVRDVFKQWYLKGINNIINSPERLLSFLEKETSGYKTICIGSSAGGYAAVLYGTLLKSDRVYAFNSQFELASLLSTSENKNPIIKRCSNSELSKYFDLASFLDFSQSRIYYMYSNRSEWDRNQKKYIGVREGIHTIGFNNPLHGVPFLKAALPAFFSLSDDQLRIFENRNFNPFFFSVKLIGLRRALIGLYKQYRVSKKR